MTQTTGSGFPSWKLRGLLVGSALLPLLLATLVSSILAVGNWLPVMLVGGISTLIALVSAWLIIQRLVAIKNGVMQPTGQAKVLLHVGNDELSPLIQSLYEHQDLHTELLLEQQQTLTAVSNNLAQIVNGSSLTPIVESLTNSNEVRSISNMLVETHKRVTTLRQRSAMAVKAIQELPIAVIAIDDMTLIRYTNRAAERLFDKPTTRLLKKPFKEFLVEPTTNDPLGRPTLGPDGLMNWLNSGATDEVVVILSAAGTIIRLALTASRTDGTWYLLAKDLGSEYIRLERDRGSTREICLRAAWGLTVATQTEPLDVVHSSVRLLTNEAKQSSGKEAILNRLKTVRQQAWELDVYVRTLRWLQDCLWGKMPEQQPSEFQSVEPVKAALEQLGARLKDRNITLTIGDEGGWMFGDEEWIRTTLLAVLAHATASVKDATIGVRVKRLPPVAGATEERISFEVVDAGPLLTPVQQSELADPFAGLNLPTYLEASTPGFLPGLVLASNLVQNMGGEWLFDTTPSRRLVVRMILPTRVIAAGDTRVTVTPEYQDSAPLEELVMGWRLGVA